MIDVILWAIAIAVFGGQYLLTRFVRPWLGAIFPVLWVASVVWLGLTGHMNSWVDYLMALIGLLVLLVLWGRGVDARNTKLKRESNRVDTLDAA